jgi:hypothetical protein
MAPHPPILVVDLETTALDEQRGAILQIGAVWLSGGPEDPELEEFSIDCRAHESALIEPKALEVNGCSLARCHNPTLPDEYEALALFAAWIIQCVGASTKVILAGLNPGFDLRWLNAIRLQACYPIDLPFPHRTIDLHTLAISYAIASEKPIPDRGFCTDEIYSLLDLPPEPRPHLAIQGARAEAAALRILLGLPNGMA